MKRILLKTRLFFKYQCALMFFALPVLKYIHLGANYVFFDACFGIGIFTFCYRELYTTYVIGEGRCKWQKACVFGLIVYPICSFINRDLSYLSYVIFAFVILFYHAMEKNKKIIKLKQ